MILQVLSAFAGGDEVHAGENQYDCGGFYQVEGLHSAAYRHNAGDDGLDIVVHAGHGRAQVFLSYHYEHVADEGRAYHDEQDADYGLGCQLVPSGGHQLVRREREDADEGVGEQPLCVYPLHSELPVGFRRCGTCGPVGTEIGFPHWPVRG